MAALVQRLLGRTEPEPAPSPFEPTNVEDRRRLRCARDRLARCEARLAELGDEINPTREGSGRWAELESERREVYAIRRTTLSEIARLTTPPLPIDEAWERKMQAFVRGRVKHAKEWIAELERQGDLRQARLARLDLLDVRAATEREYGGGV